MITISNLLIKFGIEREVPFSETPLMIIWLPLKNTVGGCANAVAREFDCRDIFSYVL